MRVLARDSRLASEATLIAAEDVGLLGTYHLGCELLKLAILAVAEVRHVVPGGGNEISAICLRVVEEEDHGEKMFKAEAIL